MFQSHHIALLLWLSTSMNVIHQLPIDHLLTKNHTMQRMFSHHPLVFEIGKKQKQYSIIRQETIYKFEQCFYIHRVVFSLWEFEFGDETFATKIPSSKSPLIK